MSLRATRKRRLPTAALLAAAALGVAATAGPAAAEETAPPAEPTATESRRPKTKLGFTSNTTRLAGPGALVDVKCMGPGSCVGTLALHVPGGSHEVAYSLSRGQKQTLVVPLGSDQRPFDGVQTAQAVAHTMQATGRSARTTRLLRIR